MWLASEEVLVIHERQLRNHGGLQGIKDTNLLHSAIAAPRNLFLYAGENDLLALAVKLCTALARTIRSRTATSGPPLQPCLSFSCETAWTY